MNPPQRAKIAAAVVAACLAVAILVALAIGDSSEREARRKVESTLAAIARGDYSVREELARYAPDPEVWRGEASLKYFDELRAVLARRGHIEVICVSYPSPAGTWVVVWLTSDPGSEPGLVEAVHLMDMDEGLLVQPEKSSLFDPDRLEDTGQ